MQRWLGPVDQLGYVVEDIDGPSAHFPLRSVKAAELARDGREAVRSQVARGDEFLGAHLDTG